jgi:hypothetical protein
VDALFRHDCWDRDAGYLTSERTDDGVGSMTTVALTTRGRAALDAYHEALRNLLGGLAS